MKQKCILLCFLVLFFVFFLKTSKWCQIFNAYNNPPTKRQGGEREKKIAHPLNESSWLVAPEQLVHTDSSLETSPISILHSHTKRRCLRPQLLICSLCFAVRRRWTTSHQSTMEEGKKASMTEQIHFFLTSPAMSRRVGGGGFHITDAVEITI